MTRVCPRGAAHSIATLTAGAPDVRVEVLVEIRLRSWWAAQALADPTDAFIVFDLEALQIDAKASGNATSTPLFVSWLSWECPHLEAPLALTLNSSFGGAFAVLYRPRSSPFCATEWECFNDLGWPMCNAVAVVTVRPIEWFSSRRRERTGSANHDGSERTPDNERAKQAKRSLACCRR